MLMRRGVKISRIFIVPSGRVVDEGCIQAVLAHVKAGIVVRIMSSDRASEIGINNDIAMNLDFGVLDDYAVSYWHHSEGKALWVSVNHADIEKYSRCFKALEAMAKPLNDGSDHTDEELSLIGTRVRSIFERELGAAI